MKKIIIIFISFFFSVSTIEPYIEVLKNGVMYKFVEFDYNTDKFVRDVFQGWEPETFSTFEKIKNPEGIALDIGSWIGTTAIWLSKNFNHVVAVDGDRVSLECLKNNLKASECNNISICEQPLAQKSQNRIFGPRENELNQSISYLKLESDQNADYISRTLTFKQLIYDYVYANNALNGRAISFIKCDIEGGEEDILEDMLYFAYHNKVKVYVSFHLPWWKSKTIDDFNYLFKHFKADCGNDISSFLNDNPFGSILFEPLPLSDIIVKKNIPVVIIAYNQCTYVKNMVDQLKKYTSDIIVIDNNSTFQPLLDYYSKEYEYTLIKLNKNHGHRVHEHNFIQKLVGELYIITDPDLQFNENLPEDFINTLVDISFYFKAAKVGFALAIDRDDINEEIVVPDFGSIKTWEKQYWLNQLAFPPRSELLIYCASVDTTFCLMNKMHERIDWTNHIRIAGDFTCVHLPWLNNFKNGLLEGEFEAYATNNISTTWSRSAIGKINHYKYL